MHSDTGIQREIIISSKEFKSFWKTTGPFAFALTSTDFPPQLMEPDEWLFANDLRLLLKELMQYDENKMKVVKAPFNPRKKNVIRPDQLSAWKINHFPEAWDSLECDIFVPQGHLTLNLFETYKKDPDQLGAEDVEDLFFLGLESCLDQLGYLLFIPRKDSKYAAVQAYLKEWEEDDMDAGLI